MKVVKFGGSSLADYDRFKTVADIIATQTRTTSITAVLSAPKTVTNQLVALCDVAEAGESFEDKIDYLQSFLLNIVKDDQLDGNETLVAKVKDIVESVSNKLTDKVNHNNFRHLS